MLQFAQIAFLAATMLAAPGIASAYEVTEVCATYIRTGAKYQVEAQIMDGSELNERVGTFRFTSYQKYVLIWWNQSEVSVIELDFSYGPSEFGTEGEDQLGRRWDISTSTWLCS